MLGGMKMIHSSKHRGLYPCSCTIAITLILALTYGAGAKEVGGLITRDTTWTLDESPYHLVNSLLIKENATLTIEPGVVVNIEPNLGIEVRGTLIAIGTKDRMITFTSSATAKKPGDWRYIKFNSSVDAKLDESGNYISGCIVKYCVVEYGGKDSEGVIWIENSKPYIAYCLIRENSSRALFSNSNGLLLEGNTFERSRGVKISGDNRVIYNTFSELAGDALDIGENNVISHNTFEGNEDYAIYICCDWDNNEITDNTFSKNGGGICFDSYSDSNTIAHNIFSENSGTAIYISSSDSNVITGNTFRGNTVGVKGIISIYYDCEDITIKDNVITDNKGTGLYICSSSTVVNHNSIYNNTPYNLHYAEGAGSGDLNARENYWGTTDEFEISKGIYDFFDDGALAIVDYSSFLLEPISEEENKPPKVSISASVTSGTAPLDITFTADASDPDGTVKDYFWFFGDGEVESTTSNSVSYIYTEGGTYKARVVVTDDKGASASSEMEINVSTPVPPEKENQFTLHLHERLNMISLPLKPKVPLDADSLAKMIGATLIIRLKPENQEFESFIPDLGFFNFEIEGGYGYIVNTPEAKDVVFKGYAWSNAPPKNPVTRTDTTWAFVIAGMVEMPEGEPPVDFRVMAGNLNRGLIASGRITPDGRFTVSFVDMSRRSVVGENDEFELKLIGEGACPSDSVRVKVKRGDLNRAFLKVRLRFEGLIPRETRLFPVYPNPCNPETWIPFELAEDEDVTIRIYDVSGRLVRELALGRLQAGHYVNKGRAVLWDGRNEKGERVASGAYVVELIAGRRYVRKIAMVK
jgi:parallel beta-helix repeat protein